MRIWVTGGLGYCGSALVPKLLALGHSVVVIDVGWFGSSHLPEHRDLTVIKQDIRQPLPEPSEPVDAIINLAAIADDHTSELDHALTWSVGAQGTLALAEYAVKHGIHRFIHASSGSIYGATEKPATEFIELHPISYYNNVKQVAERILLSYRDHFMVHIVRPGAVCGYSPRLRLETTVNNLTAQALSTGTIKVFGGSQLRPFVHIEDLCDAYIWLLTKFHLHSIHNVSFENLSVIEVAEMVQKYTGAKIVKSESNDLRSYHIDSTLIREHGFTPAHWAELAVKQLVVRYMDHAWKDEDKHYNLRVMRGWK